MMHQAINAIKAHIDTPHTQASEDVREDELAQCHTFAQTLKQLQDRNLPTARIFFGHSEGQTHHIASCPVRTHEIDIEGEFHDGLDDVVDGEAGVHHMLKALGDSFAKHSAESSEQLTKGLDVMHLSQMVGLSEGIWKKLRRMGKDDEDEQHAWEESSQHADGEWKDTDEEATEMGRDLKSPAKLVRTKYGMEQLTRYITWCTRGGEIPL